MPEGKEAELVTRAKGGDMMAFEALYDMHKGSLFRTVVAITSNRQAAEEILQEAFLRAFKRIDEIREGAPLAPWLYRVAINLAYDWTRRRQRWHTALDDLIGRLQIVTSPSPEQTIEERELYDLVYEAIERLDFKHRTTLVLFYMHDFSLEEVASIMECPVGTVKSRLYYARKKLRRELLADQRLPRGVAYEYT